MTVADVSGATAPGPLYDPFDPETIRDPHLAYARLRAQATTSYLEQYGMWVVAGFDEVRAVLRNHRTFSSAAMGDMMNQIMGPGISAASKLDSAGKPLEDFSKIRHLIGCDPPDHKRLRRMVSMPFGRPAILAMEPRIREICEEMVDDLIAANESGEADLVAHLAYPLPVIVIAEMLGVPIERRAEFKGWSDALVSSLNPKMSGAGDLAEEGQRAAVEMFEFFEQTVIERRKNPGADLVSALVVDSDANEDGLTTPEILAFCALLLGAGNETTTNLIGNGMRALFENPDQMTQLCESPSLIPSAVEEVLRYDGPVQVLYRFSTEEEVVGRKSIPAGSTVMVLPASANRDRRRYESADQFLVDRNPQDHLAFGSSIHMCLGAALARAEARIAAETLLKRVRNIRPNGPLEQTESFLIRGVTKLPVTFEPVI